MKYELNNLLRACKKKKEKKKDTARTCIYIKTEEKWKEEDELVTTCIKVNAQDVNSYTHIKKKKEGKNIHVQEIIPMKNKPHAHDTHTRVCTHTNKHRDVGGSWSFEELKSSASVLSSLSWSLLSVIQSLMSDMQSWTLQIVWSTSVWLTSFIFFSLSLPPPSLIFLLFFF